ncbi:peptide ABC transporter permease (plasmid) [Microvirga ossetica]|jgi:peptide/nickel transport system permease protein|uniref:Peptide ABC transporter permease n=1 Tax=Microvirga ossetica TaxID=1882682 RepID=A0A1B2EWU8_9HYPH|nr:ABC transporter permease [Microvirga ossetica]ANY84453.1 peptide ABC transporter permease [Microvirga ossetica]
MTSTTASAPVRHVAKPRRSIMRWVPIILIAFFVLAAVFAPLVAPYDPNSQNLLGRMRPPGTVSRSFHYLLGSDELGRDLLSRLIYGARVSLFVAIASVILSGVVGVLLGMLAGYLRGWVELIVMRLVDVFLSIPAILLAIITVAVLGTGLVNVIVVLALTRWPRYARIAYGQTLSVANMPYVRLAAFMGASTPRVLLRHILPNIIGAVTVVATLEFGLMVLFEAGLSFLGLGVQPPTASWGAMLSSGRNYLATAWWIATFPGLCLFLLILAVNLIGDDLRDRFDPRSQ